MLVLLIAVDAVDAELFVGVNCAFIAARLVLFVEVVVVILLAVVDTALLVAFMQQPQHPQQPQGIFTLTTITIFEELVALLGNV